MTASIVVGGDHTLGSVLDAVAGRLTADGHRVRRLPAEPAPLLTRFPRTQWPTFFADAEVAVISSRTVLSNDLLDWAPRLRGVVFASIGTGSCDLDHASARRIVVANGATRENVDGMAESTVMLMVALLTGLVPKMNEFGVRPVRHVAVESARMLSGKTVGFVGYGRIARQVRRRLDGWSVDRFLAYTRTDRTGSEVESTDLAGLLAASDVVSIHLPRTADTVGLFDRATISRMKPGAVLINTARGGIVDESALAELLDSGRLGGAAIDTFAQEPPAPDHPLVGRPNTILTNHNVGHTADLFSSLIPAAMDNVNAILAGRRPLHGANPGVFINQIEE